MNTENLQWWCSGALNTPWTWQWQAYPGVWIAMIALLVGYTVAVRRQGVTQKRRIAMGYAAVLCVWIVLDWPVGALGAGYLASVHALKFIVLAFLAPMLFGYAFSTGEQYEEEGGESLPASYPLAFLYMLIFNVVLVLTHVPFVVDTLASTQFGSFMTDILWLGAGMLFWRTVFKPFPLPHPAMRVLYIIFGTLIHVGFGMIFLLSPYPLYSIFELAPRVGDISARVDQGLAGAVMLLVGSPLVLFIIGRVFTPWIRGRMAERMGTPDKQVNS